MMMFKICAGAVFCVGLPLVCRWFCSRFALTWFSFLFRRVVGHHNQILGHNEQISYSLLWIVIEVPSECPVLTEIPESVSTHAKEYGMTLTLIAFPRQAQLSSSTGT